jgi:hypothetical protein
MTTKHKRTIFFEELAKSVDPRGTIAHVPGRFLQELKLYLNFSDEEISVLFGVSRPAINRKKKAAMTEPDTTPPPAVSAPPPDSQGDEMTLEEFMNAEDLSPDDEVQFLLKYGRKMMKTLPSNSREQLHLYKLLIERAETRQQADKKRQNFVKLLNFFRFEYIPACKTAFDSTFKNLKREVAHGIFTQIWLYAQDRELVKAHDAEDEARIKDEIEKKGLQIADNQGREFDMHDIFHETGMKFEPIKEAIDRHIARETGAPKLVGGGVVKSDDSKTRGAQYQRQTELQRGKRS